MSSVSTRTITYDRHGFRIDGKPRFLLAGTIAYFRLARPDWRNRLQRLRDCGFNTVDVYAPWNYHEAQEGTFDFESDNRDLAAYLSLCQKLGLFVYFRPGPYICNEWDGGGLPTWLYTKPEIRLRQNDPAYLAYVRRYLSRVNDIVRPFLHSVGGPVILYALENELDFYPCEDPHGYISALRDQVLADGIDVPLTACIGNRTPVRAATGLVDGVIPSPNIYEGVHIERESVRAREVLHGGHFASGASMSDLPAFVTEMGRDENSLKRILSTGYRGLGPFNFAGGANFGYTHAVNNWANLAYLATSIDFDGMIGFDGRLQPAFYDARRFAGLIRAFEEEILTADPVTSACGGPTSTSSLLGAGAAEQRPNQIYSLAGEDESAFIFLPNLTDAVQSTQVQVGELCFPRYSAFTIAPGYTHVAVANLRLDRQGIAAQLLYSTAEVVELQRDDECTHLLVCGELSAEAELCLQASSPVRVEAVPTAIRVFTERDTTTLVFRCGEICEVTLWIGDSRLRLTIADRETAARHGLDYVPPTTRTIDLLALPREEGVRELPMPASRLPDGGMPLEELGVYKGAGWYSFAFELPASCAVAEPEITLPHAGDLVTAYVDGRYCGAFVGDGGPLTIPLPLGVEPGSHTLLLRTEIWGHSNFHDERWPSARLGSLRGVWGTPEMTGAAISGIWRFVSESSVLPPLDAERKPLHGAIRAEGGEIVRALIASPELAGAAQGALLTLNGQDCFGTIHIGERVVGRFLFGPALSVSLTGGPADRFFLPGDYLASGEPLSIVVHGVGNGGAITSSTIDIFRYPDEV